MVGKVNTSLNWLTAVEADRRAAGLRRELRPRTVDSPLIDLASNDYLGLVRPPDVFAGAAAALRPWGAGAARAARSRWCRTRRGPTKNRKAGATERRGERVCRCAGGMGVRSGFFLMP